MPKTKSTSKKKPNSAASFWTKLNPNTGKKKLLLFVLAFVLVGGGVMAYRSFATAGFGVYTPDKLTTNSKAVRLTEQSGSKSGGQVITLRNGGKTSIASNWEPTVWAPFVRACANIRSSNNNEIYSTVGVSIGGNEFAPGSYTRPVGIKYTKVCGDFVSHTNPNARVGGYVRNSDSLAKTIVGSISIEYMFGGGK